MQPNKKSQKHIWKLSILPGFGTVSSSPFFKITVDQSIQKEDPDLENTSGEKAEGDAKNGLLQSRKRH